MPVVAAKGKRALGAVPCEMQRAWRAIARRLHLSASSLSPNMVKLGIGRALQRC